MFMKLYKWTKAATALVLALLLVTTVLEVTVPMLASGMLCKAAGLMVANTLGMYAIKTLGFFDCCNK